MFRIPRIAVLTVCTLALALAPSQADAQVKPFKVTGTGVGPMGIPLPGEAPRPHWIVGNATELGRHFGIGSVQTDSATFNADGTITGFFQSGSPFDFIGANGDILSCDYGKNKTGTFTLVPVAPVNFAAYPFVPFIAYWVADFVPNKDCTGKFAGVTGGWTMYAVSEPFYPFAISGGKIVGSTTPAGYSWHGEGTLTYQKGK